MTQLFGLPIDTLATILVIISGVIIGVTLLLAIWNRIFFKIGVRNIPRRRTQMILIVFALMLSTTLLSSVLTTGDVMTSAVKSVAVYNLGSVDELIEGGRGPVGTYPDRVYYDIARQASQAPSIAAVAAIPVVTKTLMLIGLTALSSTTIILITFFDILRVNNGSLSTH